MKKTKLAVLILLSFVLLKCFLPPRPALEKNLMEFFVADEEKIETIGRSLEGKKQVQSAFRQNA